MFIVQFIEDGSVIAMLYLIVVHYLKHVDLWNIDFIWSSLIKKCWHICGQAYKRRNFKHIQSKWSNTFINSHWMEKILLNVYKCSTICLFHIGRWLFKSLDGCLQGLYIVVQMSHRTWILSWNFANCAYIYMSLIHHLSFL